MRKPSNNRDRAGSGTSGESISVTPLSMPALDLQLVEIVTDEPAIEELRQEFEREVAQAYDETMRGIFDEVAGLQEGRIWVVRLRRDQCVQAMKAMMCDARRSARARTSAAYVLFRLGEPSGEAFLLDSLTAKDAELRCFALKKMRAPMITFNFDIHGRADLVLSMISDPDADVRTAAVELCADYKISGTEQALVRLLEEGGAPDPNAVASQLGLVASTPETVQVMLKHLEGPGEKRTPDLWYFRNLMDDPRPEVSEPIRKAIHARVRSYQYDPNHEQYYVSPFSQTATRDSLPQLEEIYRSSRDSVCRSWALEAIARLQPETAVERALDHLRKEQSGTWTVVRMLKGRVTEADADRLISKLLRKSNWLHPELVQFLVEELGEKGRQAVVRRLLPGQIESNMCAYWRLEGITLLDALEDLAEAGLITEPPDRFLESMNRPLRRGILKPVDISNPESLVEALRYANRLVYFDYKTGEIPVEHVGLLREFAEASQGALPLEASTQTYYPATSDDEPDSYLVQFLSRGKRYSFFAGSYGSTNDGDSIFNALNVALVDAGRKERYFRISSFDGGAMCADPEVFFPIAAKYRLC